MRWSDKLRLRYRSLCRKDHVEAELDEELRYHLERQIEENIRAGMTPEEARRAARLEFGGVEQLKEECRDQRGVAWIETLWQDLRYGARMLAKSPGFTAVAVLSLALGIGANTAIFSVFDTVHLRPLPYEHAERLVAVREITLGKPDWYRTVSLATFFDWKEQTTAFEELAGLTWDRRFTMTGGERAERLYVRFVTEGYLRMMGARACQGRLFVREDYTPEADPMPVVISHGCWQRVFGSDSDIVGRAVKLDGLTHVVAGVLCPGYRPLQLPVAVWTPVTGRAENRKERGFGVIGRLKRGTDIRTAQAQLDVIARRLEEEYPETHKGIGAQVGPIHRLLYGYETLSRTSIWFGAAVFLLLIACVNVASLMVARAVAREREMAVRSSLGASRPRLVRQLLTESVLLVVLGAALGLLLGYGGMKLLVSAEAAPRFDEVAMNLRVLGFTLAVATLTGLLFGLVPALRASKPNLNESLKETGRRSAARFGIRRPQSVLVVVELALSLILLTGAGLMIHNIWRLYHVNLGFNSKNLLTVRVALPEFEYIDVDGDWLTLKPRGALVRQGIRERLQALPGVKSVSFTNWSSPLRGFDNRPVSVGAQPPRSRNAYHPVGPAYFRTVEIPLLKGRGFTELDDEDSPKVAVINESLARRYFPDEEPLGQRLNIGHRANDEVERREIVGVVADIRQLLTREPYSAVYVPYAQVPRAVRASSQDLTDIKFVIRGAADPAVMAPAIRQAVSEVAGDVPVTTIETVDHVQSLSLRRSRLNTWLLAVAAGIAVVLAAIGVFGVTSYSVTRRTHEIGIRMALGARPGNVLRLVMRQGLTMTAIGLTIGLGGAFGLARFLESQLFEVESTDPATFAAVAVVLAVVALLACFVPARRATRIDPVVALRHE